MPPIIHYLVLSNIAWLKRPASGSRLKLHELVALCSAALRPSREAWQAFLEHLQKLMASGVLPSDEVTALVATDLTDKILVEAEIDEGSDAATLTEVVERLKASYRAEADERVGRAEQAVRETEARELRMRQHVERRARGIAKAICWALAGIAAIAFLAGTVLTVVSAADGSGLELPGVLLATILAVGSLMSLLWGFHLNQSRTWLEDRLARWLEGWLGAAEVDGDASSER